MSNLNSKNVLQELLIRNKHSSSTPPIYVTGNVENNKSLPPIWLSTVTVIFNGQEITVTGEKQSTKTKAEISAASSLLLLPQLSSSPSSQTHSSSQLSLPSSQTHSSSQLSLPSPPSQTHSLSLSSQMSITVKDCNRGIYLIDLENIPLLTKQTASPDQLWIGFISQTHATVDKYTDWYRSDNSPLYGYKFGCCFLYVLDNQGRKDMMDHYITAFTYPIATYIHENKITDPVYIISKDLAAWCSKSCLEFWLADLQLINKVIVSSKM
jgi:hypothetical protein